MREPVPQNRGFHQTDIDGFWKVPGMYRLQTCPAGPATTSPALFLADPLYNAEEGRKSINPVVLSRSYRRSIRTGTHLLFLHPLLPSEVIFDKIEDIMYDKHKTKQHPARSGRPRFCGRWPWFNKRYLKLWMVRAGIMTQRPGHLIFREPHMSLSQKEAVPHDFCQNPFQHYFGPQQTLCRSAGAPHSPNGPTSRFGTITRKNTRKV